MRIPATLITLLFLSISCGPANRVGGRPPGVGQTGAPVAPVPVSDVEFARSAYQVLVNGTPNQQRTELLAGVVRRQLARAARRFERGQTEAGMQALTGAFYLLRAGELHTAMLEGGAYSLGAGAAEVSRVGNEGKALALYGMLRSLIAERDRQDVDAHLAALARWSATRRSGPMQGAGADQRASVQRALYESRVPALNTARDKTVAWIRRALDSNVAELPVRTSLERDEAIEAYRALRAGGATLVAIYLRHGDPRGALDAIDGVERGTMRLVPPGLRDRLERIATENDPVAWRELTRLFEAADDGDRPETSIDRDLARGAAWGTALGLYRTEPNALQSVEPVARQLLGLGMAEVAPLIAAPALGEQSTIDDVGWALQLTLRAVVAENDVGELEAARRAFAAAAPIMALASKRFGSRVRPSPARLEYVMGLLEIRAGELQRARPHMEAAARAEPSIESYLMLSLIDRQRGDPKAALRSLEQVTALARKASDAAAEADALVTAFEIHRDRSDGEAARTALHAALKRALDARQLARNAAAQARAERLLARVLDYYGDEQGARRAIQRAFTAAGADMDQLSATVQDASRRALTRSDLPGARDAVQRAVEARLPAEDMVYVALWLQLLERKLNVPSDGTAEEAYATIDDASGWPGRLRAWGRGKLSDDELMKGARSRVERTEAIFYTAMARAVQGNRDAALPKLREVAMSEAIQLAEVTIARDLLAQQASPPLDFRLPTNVDVP